MDVVVVVESECVAYSALTQELAGLLVDPVEEVVPVQRIEPLPGCSVELVDFEHSTDADDEGISAFLAIGCRVLCCYGLLSDLFGELFSISTEIQDTVVTLDLAEQPLDYVLVFVEVLDSSGTSHSIHYFQGISCCFLGACVVVFQALLDELGQALDFLLVEELVHDAILVRRLIDGLSRTVTFPAWVAIPVSISVSGLTHVPEPASCGGVTSGVVVLGKELTQADVFPVGQVTESIIALILAIYVIIFDDVDVVFHEVEVVLCEFACECWKAHVVLLLE